MFQKLDTDDSNTISLAELESAMVSNNVPMKSAYRPQRKDSINSNGQTVGEGISQAKKNTVELKIFNAFSKLNQKMLKNGITLVQVFDAYDVNKDGDITIKEFSRILKRLDETLTDQEIEIGFGFVDLDGSKSITFVEFNGYFCKCTGQPVKDFMSARN